MSGTIAPIDLAIIAAGTGGFVIIGKHTSDFSGRSVASAGDINGDGFADLIIGADRGDGTTGFDSGDSYVVFGKASGWGAAIDLGAIASGNGGFVMNGRDVNDRSGRSVASAGDINGDGFADLIIGAYRADGAGNAKADAGESYVVFGKASGWGAAISLNAIAGGTGGFVINGRDVADYSGWSVASAGDINGDGFADLIIGASTGDAAGNAKSYAGESYVVFGKASGWGAAIDLEVIAGGTGGFVINGRDANDRSGYSVASAGDINGDGFADLIIGAALESYVVFGKASGWGAAIDLGAIAGGTGGFVINGREANDGSGRSAASAGDINGDGFADLIIGARWADAAGNEKNNAGESYVVFGKASGWGAAIDLEVIAGGTGGFVLNGRDANDQSGFSVASAGDINGDGLDDVIIGPRYGDAAGNAKSMAGESYVVFGKVSGWGAAIDLEAIAGGTGGFVINGRDSSDYFGRSVASAGDIDGDGFDDLIIGAVGGDVNSANPGDNRGESYVIFGRDFTGTVTHAGTTGAEVLTGDAGANVMVAGLGDDTLNGGGGADALEGGADDDRLVVNDFTFLRADGGSGTDTLALAGSGVTLNLGTIADTKLQGIEAIDLGSGANTLRITALEVLNLSDTSNTVRITGAAGSVLTLDDSGWAQGATSGGFMTLTNGQALLQVQASVRVSNLLPIDLENVANGMGGFVINGQDGGDRSGISVASAGDINGDGFADLIIGADYGDAVGNAKNSAGESYVVFGKASGWGAAIDLEAIAGGTGGFVINGRDASDYSGRSVASAGDINGDGFADLIIGAFGGDGTSTSTFDNRGESYVVFGKTSGWGAAIDLAAIAGGTGGFVINGRDAGDNSGISVASAGDINGDGFADLIIGASGGAGADNTKFSAGESYVVFGKTSGWGAAIDLAAIAGGTGGFVIIGRDILDGSGGSVASAGDINGDGFADLIIGAHYGDAAGNAKSYAGESYVVFGKAGGWGAAIDLAAIAGGTGGFVINGRDAIDESGASVASAGDINGDGFADLIIGARSGDGTSTSSTDNRGESYVVFGKASGWGAAIDLAAIAGGTGGFVINGRDAGDYSGFPVASAGDINGDGFDDLIIGARGGDGTSTSTTDGRGESYVVFGKASGWGAAIDLEAIAGGTGGFVINGRDAYDVSGLSVASAGDIDGDGFDDLIIGARSGDGTSTSSSDNRGESYVIFGRDFTGTVTHAGTTGAEVLTGDAGANVMVAGLGNDTLNGGGGADALEGGAGDDRLVVSDFTFLRADGGSGTDTLALAGSGVTLNLATIADTKLQGIEAIDLGSGANTLRITALEVLNLSDTSNTVRITGATGSVLRFDDIGWVETARADGFVTLTNGAATAIVATTLIGGPTAGNDNLFGTNGHDFIDALAGDDSVAGNGGNDTLVGSAGNDLLSGGAGNDSVMGGAGNDTLTADAGTEEFVFGGEASDSLAGGEGSFQYLYGEAGTDTLSVGSGANQYLFGGDSADALFAGSGAFHYLYGEGGDDNLTAGSGNSQYLFGGIGADRLQAGSGNDHNLDGQIGNDTLIGGAGLNQVLFGGDNDDSLLGGTGSNQILLGELGNDTLVAGGTTGQTLSGGDGVDSLVGSTGNDSLSFGAGDERFTYDIGNGRDTLDGGAGSDTLTLTSDAWTESSSEGWTILTSVDAVLYVRGWEAISSGKDTLFAGNNDGAIVFGAGNTDSLMGGAGRYQQLHGQGGADTLVAGSGSDQSLFGGVDADSLSGGSGGYQYLHGQGGNDTLLAGSGDNLYMFGGDGTDSLVGGIGDYLRMYGEGGNDTLRAGSGNYQFIDGGSGDDVIIVGSTPVSDIVALFHNW